MPYTFNGIGTRFYGRRDEAADGSYVTTEWFTFVYVPLIPIRSLRVLPVGQGTNYVVHRSQNYQTMRVPFCWAQVRNIYMFIAPIVLIVLYFNRQDIDDWFRHDVLKQPVHMSLAAERTTSPVEQPLSPKDAAVACGQVLKLERPAFDGLDLTNRLSTVVTNTGFTQQETQEIGDSQKNLEEQAFQAYSFAYLTWDKSEQESLADFDKRLVKVLNAQDLSTLSSDERVKVNAFFGKVKTMMLHAFQLGRHDARISPCPVQTTAR